jgi:hypothetical protein
LRRLCDVAPETRIVCYANRIGLDMGILEVVGALAQMQTPAILVCVGRFTNAETERAVRECIAGLGQADSVRFVDNQPPEAFARLLSGADVGVNAIKPLSLNLRVSLPNRIFDYVAARVPIVTSDVGDSAQVVREHAIGEVLEAVEPGAIARALDQVLAQPEAYATRLEDAARALSWDREAQEYARTALKLAGRTRGPRRAAIVARKQIGYNNRILQQARTLHDLGFEVTVASTSGFDPAVAAELPAGVQELVIPWSATTRAPSQKPAAAAERRVRELLAEERRLEEAIADGAADADVQPQATQRLIRRLRRIEAISRGLTRTHARLRALGADVED